MDELKHDDGKLRLTLVPQAIIWHVAAVREFGSLKYKDPENWKNVSAQRYRDALMRHVLRYLEDPQGKDDDSSLPHLWHVACNVAFLCALEKFDVERIMQLAWPKWIREFKHEEE